MIYILLAMFFLNATCLVTIVYLVNKRLDTLSGRWFRMTEYIEKVIEFKKNIRDKNEAP